MGKIVIEVGTPPSCSYCKRKATCGYVDDKGRFSVCDNINCRTKFSKRMNRATLKEYRRKGADPK